jgi:hypothetical protein
MKPARWVITAIAAAGAAGAVYVFQPVRGTVPTAPATQTAPVERAAGSFITALSDLDRAAPATRMQRDPFATAIPQPTTAPARVAIAPTRPAMPAFPYKYAGTLKKTNGVTEAFLLRGAELVPIKAGELLDGTWRIEALTEERIEVTYVPVGERVSMLLANLVGEGGIAVGQSAVATPAVAYTGPTGVEPSPLPPRANVAAGSGTGGGFAVVPSTSAPAVAAPRATPNASAAAAPAVTGAPAATSIALGTPTPASATPLGSEPPMQGSMPLGAPPSGSFPKGNTPTGKLGL